MGEPCLAARAQSWLRGMCCECSRRCCRLNATRAAVPRCLEADASVHLPASGGGARRSKALSSTQGQLVGALLPAFNVDPSYSAVYTPQATGAVLFRNRPSGGCPHPDAAHGSLIQRNMLGSALVERCVRPARPGSRNARSLAASASTSDRRQVFALTESRRNVTYDDVWCALFLTPWCLADCFCFGHLRDATFRCPRQKGF